MERYGVENVLCNEEIREKIKNTIVERYGVDNVLLNKEIKDKRDNTLLNNFGTLYPLQNKECLKKLRQTNMDKYGVENIGQLEETKQRVRETNLERYGYENIMQSPEFLEKWFAKNGSNFVIYDAVDETVEVSSAGDGLNALWSFEPVNKGDADIYTFYYEAATFLWIFPVNYDSRGSASTFVEKRTKRWFG